MLTPTLIRRYTPPTCSLEVVAKTSALSQWTGNPVIKELKFELSLDDPRLVTENRILLTGDRQQLEELAIAVTDYVQNFLQQTNPAFDFDLDFAPTPNIYTYQAQGAIAKNLATITKPQLETKGLLSHQLHLGRLANDGSGKTIQLSITQLYDLANALESYSADMVALPILTKHRNRKTAMRWGAVAASFLLVVGLSKTAFDLQQANQLETATNSRVPEAVAADDFEQQQVVRPNLHSSYSFAAVPELEDTLTAGKAEPSVVNLAPIPPGQPPAPRPRPTTSSAPVAASPQPRNNQPSTNPKSAPNTAPAEPRPQPPAIASAPTDVLIPRQVASAPTYPAPATSGTINESNEQEPQAIPGATARRSADADVVPALDTAYVFSDTGNRQEKIVTIPPGDRRQQTQQYFDQRWQTPEGLDETLEYRLQIDATGTLQTVMPLGKAAELYQGQLAYLTTGNQIIPPSDRTPKLIRLVLDPDGTVQTFEE